MFANTDAARFDELMLQQALGWDPSHQVRVRYRMQELDTGKPLGRFLTQYFPDLPSARAWVVDLDIIQGTSPSRVALAGVIHEWRGQPRLHSTFVLC